MFIKFLTFRQNCLPGTTPKDEALCTSKGCLWDENIEINEPQCYYPENFKTFTIDGDVTTEAQGNSYWMFEKLFESTKIQLKYKIKVKVIKNSFYFFFKS